MTKLDEFADRNRFNGISHAPKIGELDQHDIIVQFIHDGANLAFGSDSPVETMDPLAGIHAAVTRRNAQGEPADGWYPQERVSLETAVEAYTAGCASATGEEDKLARIAPGYWADFVVLSHDLFALDDSMRILEARAEVTVVGGEVVYRRGESPRQK